MADAEVAAEQIRDKIGAFKITRSLGKGLMGECVQGTTGDNVYYAIKVINQKVAKKLDSAIRFEGEITGDNVMKIQVKTDPKLGFYFLMDFLEVRPVGFKTMKGRGHVAILDLFSTIAKAIGQVHAKGVVHGNIKATNILVRPSGKSLMPFVNDFGLEYIWDKDYFSGERFQDAFSSMAPEKIAEIIPGSMNGAPKVGPATDVYSLAAVLCDALTGKRLFWDSENAEDLILKKRDPRFQLIAVTHPARKIDIKAMNDLMARCLSFDPSKRPQTMQAFSEGLEACRVPPDKMYSKE